MTLGVQGTYNLRNLYLWKLLVHVLSMSLRVTHRREAKILSHIKDYSLNIRFSHQLKFSLPFANSKQTGSTAIYQREAQKSFESFVRLNDLEKYENREMNLSTDSQWILIS